MCVAGRGRPPGSKKVRESARGNAAPGETRVALERLYVPMRLRSGGASYVGGASSFGELSALEDPGNVELGMQLGYRMSSSEGRLRHFGSGVVVVVTNPDAAVSAPVFLRKEEGPVATSSGKGKGCIRCPERVVHAAFRFVLEVCGSVGKPRTGRGRAVGGVRNGARVCTLWVLADGKSPPSVPSRGKDFPPSAAGGARAVFWPVQRQFAWPQVVPHASRLYDHSGTAKGFHISARRGVRRSCS